MIKDRACPVSPKETLGGFISLGGWLEVYGYWFTLMAGAKGTGRIDGYIEGCVNFTESGITWGGGNLGAQINYDLEVAFLWLYFRKTGSEQSSWPF